ncbi:hypothetical protein ABIE66_002967 [Peribacillus sp. B2I2]
MKIKKKRVKIGNVYAIPLPDKKYAFGKHLVNFIRMDVLVFIKKLVAQLRTFRKKKNLILL